MKKLLLIVIAVGALNTLPALAADMPIKAPPAIEPHFSWTGFYFGADVGGGWARTNVTTEQLPVTPGVSGDFQRFPLNGSGALGGFHAGYNWQVAPTWLLGVEGDFDWTRIRANTSGAITIAGVPVPASTDSLSRNVNWLSTIRGRVGYTMSDWLFYATGGAAWGGLSESAAQTAFGLVTWGPFTSSSARSGWVTGAGVEHALNKNWILRAEYLFYSLNGLSGSGTGSLPGTGIFADSFGRTNIQTIRAGISYKFN